MATETDFLREAIIAQGGNCDDLPDNLESTLYKKLIETCAGGGDLPFGKTKERVYLLKDFIAIPNPQLQNRIFINNSMLQHIEVGESYTITLGGIDYECVAVDGSFMGDGIKAFLGNATPFGFPEVGNSEPFALAVFDQPVNTQFYGQFVYSSAPSPLLSIQGEIEVIKQMPPEYIPAQDWAAAANETGHIKNRTHYGHYKTDVTLYSGDITVEEHPDPFGGVGYYANPENAEFPVNVGDTMYTVFGSSKHLSTVFSPRAGAIAWGNMALADRSEDTGEPFCVLYDASQGYCAVYGAEAAEKIQFDVYLCKVVADKQLDPAYIPDNSCFLTSPNGTRYQLTVGDDGTLTATAL